MSTDSLAAHEKRWTGAPTLPQAVGASYPAMDGDLAELDGLAERVLDALAELPWPATGRCCIGGDSDTIYRELRSDAGFPFAFGFHYWPDDRAAEQCAVWRAQLDGII